MTATGDLRRLLDERGVRHSDGFPYTTWLSSEGLTTAYENVADDTLMLSPFTPEQAIEATLGRGECCDKNGRNRRMGFECTVCGVMCSDCDMLDMSEGFVHFRYCPSCGRRVRA